MKSISNRMLFVLLFSIATTFFFSGCETSEDRQLAAGKQCIDNAQSVTDADTCYNLVNGLTSAKANLIRCSSHFIAQGFTGQRFANAFQKIKDGTSGGQNSVSTAMAYMAFAVSSTVHTADNAVTDCTASGIRSMERLATLAKLATTISQAGLGSIPDPTSPSFDPATITTAIQNLISTPSASTNQAIGAVTQQAYSSYCNAGSSFIGTSVCTTVGTAIANGNGDAQAIGAALLQLVNH